MQSRFQLLQSWLTKILSDSDYELKPLTGDASFRSYYRLQHNARPYIVMDSPPDQEDSCSFYNLAKHFESLGLNVPHIYFHDFKLGFLVLSDLGATHYLDVLNETNAQVLYSAATVELLTLQTAGSAQCLPLFDRTFMQTEFQLFTEWFLQKGLNLSLSLAQACLIDTLFNQLCEHILSQPKVCIHRDYHSRNLMYSEKNKPGILDFQDAMIGPITYDLVSLLKDCYIAWPKESVMEWALAFQRLLVNEQRLDSTLSSQQFLRWFDWMGLQRHLKVLGIFSRLYLRDGKVNYLQHLPLVLQYIQQVSESYPELHEFDCLIKETILPRFEQALFSEVTKLCVL